MLDSWKIIKNINEYAIQKTYPDGTDVIISIKKNKEKYEIWSSAEHRLSGPNDHLDGIANTLEEAKVILKAEATEWDDDLL